MIRVDLVIDTTKLRILPAVSGSLRNNRQKYK